MRILLKNWIKLLLEILNIIVACFVFDKTHLCNIPVMKVDENFKSICMMNPYLQSYWIISL